jgi:hypothetical protein
MRLILALALAAVLPAYATAQVSPPQAKQADVTATAFYPKLLTRVNYPDGFTTEPPRRPDFPRVPSIDSSGNPRAPKDIRVQVVSLATGEPIPGARVTWFDYDDPKAWAAYARLPDAPTLPAALIPGKEAVSADADGRGRFPESESRTLIVATSGKACGFGFHHPLSALPSLQIQIAIAEPRTAAVHVTDLSGATGVHVPVSLQRQLTRRVWNGGTTEESSWTTLLTRATDNTGTATFHFANLFAPRSGGEAPAELPRLEVASLGGEPTRLKADWNQGLEARLEAVVDLGVEIKLRLVDAFGHPLDDLQSPRNSVPFELPDLHARGSAPLEKGVVSLGRLPRGARVTLDWDRAGLSGWARPDPAEISAPRELIRAAHLTIPLTFPGYTFEGRFVDEAGQPRAGVTVPTGCGVLVAPNSGGHGPAIPRHLRSDADGRFRVRLFKESIASHRGEATSGSGSSGSRTT